MLDMISYVAGRQGTASGIIVFLPDRLKAKLCVNDFDDCFADLIGKEPQLPDFLRPDFKLKR